MTVTIKDIEVAMDKYEGLTLFLAGVRSTLHEVTSLGIKHYERAEAAKATITALEAESASLMLAIDNGQEWSEATITALEAEIESARKIIALYERDIPLLTMGMEFHPKGWEHACECQMCMSYEPEQSK